MQTADAKHGTKYCAGCRRWRQLEEYTTNRNRVDGLQTWCQQCLEALETMPTGARKKAVARYKKDRTKAYQIWFRESTHATMIDKRWAVQPGSPLVRLRWSRRLERVTAFDGSDQTTTMRSMLIGPFRCEPTEVDVLGRGGGTGSRWQPKCRVEGSTNEKNWKLGLQELATQEWAILREGFEDVVAVGF